MLKRRYTMKNAKEKCEPWQTKKPRFSLKIPIHPNNYPIKCSSCTSKCVCVNKTSRYMCVLFPHFEGVCVKEFHSDVRKNIFI